MKIGLCLSGGGVKGAAHIGVIKALEEENIKIDYISGTSSGSIVAALYACGYSSDEMLDIFKKYAKKIKYIDFKNVLKLIGGIIIKREIIIDGLTEGKAITKIMCEACSKKNIVKLSDISMPILIPSVDLHTGELYFFVSKLNRRGFSDNIIYTNNIDVADAVRASCSYPGVFTPCRYEGVELIDGGIRENTPWRELKKMGADTIISVIFEKREKEKCCRNVIEVVENSLNIMSHELANYELMGNTGLLRIESDNVGLLDVSKIQELYKIGYREGKSFIKNKLAIP